MKKKQDFLSIADLTPTQLRSLLSLALQLKKQFKKEGQTEHSLAHKTLVLIFEKPSLRTRLSFEAGMTQLGGHAVYLSPADIGLGVRESIQDLANEKERRLKVFKSYQVTPNLMNLAQKNAIFMHDMPIYRGQEVTADVVDGPASTNLIGLFNLFIF